MVSKRFHLPSNREEMAGTEKLVATILLRASLESSLARVLRSGEHKLAVESFKSLHNANGHPGAVLSGSVMVQTVLGEVWGNERKHGQRCKMGKPDLDVFCTAAAAVQVRTQLVADKYYLTGFPNSAYDTSINACGTAVHHVEQYAREEGDLPPVERYVQKEQDGDGEEDEEIYDFVEFAKEVMRASAGENFPCSLQNQMADVGIPFRITNDHVIKVSKGNLVYDRDGQKTVDMVVGESGVTNALDLLESFDIILCKASFDGNRFRIPFPHLSFNHVSSMDPARLKLMQQFCVACKKYAPDKLLDEDGILPEALLSQLASGQMAAADLREVFDVESASTRAYYQNFFARLFKRYKKYTDRGVHIDVDAHGSREVHRAFLKQAEVLSGAEGGQGGVAPPY
jgi:hypothetical protein